MELEIKKGAKIVEEWSELQHAFRMANLQGKVKDEHIPLNKYSNKKWVSIESLIKEINIAMDNPNVSKDYRNGLIYMKFCLEKALQSCSNVQDEQSSSVLPQNSGVKEEE